MYAIYGNIYHQYTPNVSIYTIHGSYGLWFGECELSSKKLGLTRGRILVMYSNVVNE